MPAGLSMRSGAVEMMYVGQVPWHGLGQKLDQPATAAEAIRAAHLDWEVTKVPIFLKGRRSYREIPSRFAVVRTDIALDIQAPALGIVGKSYRPLQNQNAFEWFDGIVGKGAAVYHTAGALRNGERIWILAKLPGEIRVAGDDVADKFLLLSNSHDGESSVQVKFTPIRVVCKNTLTMALNHGPSLRVGHTRSLNQQLDLAKVNLGIINHSYEEIEKEFKKLAAVQVQESRLREYLISVFPEPKNPDDQPARKRVVESRAMAAKLFESGRGNDLPAVRGTLWAAYNGVTEYIDYRGVNQAPNQRLDSIWFGSGYLTKARAFKEAVAKSIQWKN